MLLVRLVSHGLTVKRLMLLSNLIHDHSSCDCWFGLVWDISADSKWELNVCSARFVVM